MSFGVAMKREFGMFCLHYGKGNCDSRMHRSSQGRQAALPLRNFAQQEAPDRVGGEEEVQFSPSPTYLAQGDQGLGRPGCLPCPQNLVLRGMGLLAAPR